MVYADRTIPERFMGVMLVVTRTYWWRVNFGDPGMKSEVSGVSAESVMQNCRGLLSKRIGSACAEQW